MDNIIPTNEYTEFEGRYYANPQVSLDRSNQFIDNLRATQGIQNQEIAQQTQNLGTEVPSNLGGLTGGESYFASRYQTPQTNAVTANLRAIAQAQALNDVLSNEQAIWKKRYQDTYRAYQKRQNDRVNNPQSPSQDTSSNLPIDVNSNDGDNSVSLNTNIGAGKYVPVTDYVGDYLSEDGKQWWTLGSLMQSDEVNLSGRGMYDLENGETITRNGITYMYLENDQFPNGRWFRANLSAGPGTYSPYAGVNQNE